MQKIISLILLTLVTYTEAQSIKTIQLINPYRQDANPVMSMDEKLTLSFDDLDNNYTKYTYKITRYTASWKPSKAFATEYIQGYSKNTIRDYKNSYNTRQIYTHYKLEFPNRNLKFKLSGNYKIEVLKKNKTLFSRRFIVYEDKATIGVNVNRFATSELKNQKVSVIAQSNQYDFTKSQDLVLFIYKNNNLNDNISLNQTSFIQPHQLKYVNNDIRFSGGVEYQSFDTKDINNGGMTTQDIIQDSIYQTILFPVSFNPDLPYIERPDINGEFIPRVLVGRKEYSASTQADYTRVHFALDNMNLSLDTKICIYGGFNNFKCEDDDFLTYDEYSHLWVTNKLLKQGYYNYNFGLVDDGKLYPEAISGSYWETENEYSAILYYKPWGSRYDLAIGLGEGFSRESQR